MVRIARRIDTPVATAAPHVGFFWFVKEEGAWHLIADAIPAAGAEPYGDCLTHPGGHYDLWTNLAAKGAAWLKANGYPIIIALSEYEDHPRGRVVFDTASAAFVVYFDPRLSGPLFRSCLKVAFGLAKQRLVYRRDPHYQPLP